MTERAQLQALVRGYVQGVGFRFFVQDAAEALGLVGYVRNLREGHAVEVVAEGPRTQLEALLARLLQGPPGAWVEKVEPVWGPPTGSYSRFEVGY